MRAITETDLKNSLISGSSKVALMRYRERLLRDGDKTHSLHDDRVKQVLEEYARDSQISDVDSYLTSLKLEDGSVFTRDCYSYEAMLSKLDGFKQSDRPSFQWNENYQKALLCVTERYSNAKLTARIPSNNEDIYAILTKLNTSAGWASIAFDGIAHKGDFKDRIYDVWRDSTNVALQTGSYNFPILLAHRTQASGEFDDEGNQTGTFKKKSRPVDMVDVRQVITERIFGDPMNGFLAHYSYSAIGKDDSMILQDLHGFRREEGTYISLDYSAYDSTIPAWLLHDAFRVLRSAFFMDSDLECLMRIIEEDFINKNFVLADTVLHVTHGNPSGSGLTAIINGICNEIITETWGAKFNLPTSKYMIMGDDNIIYNRFLDRVNLQEVANYISWNFGVKVNADKTTEGHREDDPEFLSRTWTWWGVKRETHSLISKMLYPERFRNYKGTDLTPEMVIYAYILGYRLSMNEIIDVERFLEANQSLVHIAALSIAQIDQLPYNAQLVYLKDGKRKQYHNQTA